MRLAERQIGLSWQVVPPILGELLQDKILRNRKGSRRR